MSKGNVVAMDLDLAKEKDSKLKTNKKYLKQVEKIVRGMDNVLTDLHDVSRDVDEGMLNFNSSEVTEKDNDRFEEMRSVLNATEEVLYQLTRRMARKYVGKDIDTVDNPKRKSLKL